jgi:hypothetical protein
MSVPTSAKGAATKLRKAADCVSHDFLYDDDCGEAAEALPGQIAERVALGENEASDVPVLRFMEKVLRYLDENRTSAGDLIGSTLQWLAPSKLV